MAELHRQFEEAGGTTAFYSRVVGGAMAGPLKRLVRESWQAVGQGGQACRTCCLAPSELLLCLAIAALQCTAITSSAKPHAQRVQDANSSEEIELSASMVVNAAGLHAQVSLFAGRAVPAVALPCCCFHCAIRI